MRSGEEMTDYLILFLWIMLAFSCGTCAGIKLTKVRVHQLCLEKVPAGSPSEVEKSLHACEKL
jgi:hypothetical protein